MPRKKKQTATGQKAEEEIAPNAEGREQYQQPAYLEFIQSSDLADPLTEITRRERRHLLIASLISLAITLGSLIPSKVSALGITVSQAQQVNLHLLLALIIIYFMFSFCFYGHVDYQHWLVKMDTAQRYRTAAIAPILDHFKRIDISGGILSGQSKDEQQRQVEHLSNLERHKAQLELSESLMRSTRRRVFFEFFTPLGAGLWALVLVLDEGRGFALLARPVTWIVDHPVLSSFFLAVGTVLAALKLKFRDLKHLKKSVEDWKKLRLKNQRNRIVEKMQRLEKGTPEWRSLQEQGMELLEREFKISLRGVGVKDVPPGDFLKSTKSKAEPEQRTRE